MCDTEDGYKNVSKNHVVRFNLSVNDATRKNGQGVFMITNTRAKTDIYNNTLVATNDGRNLVYTFGGKCMNISFTNNIFYGNGFGKILRNAAKDAQEGQRTTSNSSTTSKRST